MCRLLRAPRSQRCTIACGLQPEIWPAPTFLLHVSHQLVLSSHEYQRGLIFLVHVCGIVQAQFEIVYLSLCVYTVHTRIGVAAFIKGMTELVSRMYIIGFGLTAEALYGFFWHIVGRLSPKRVTIGQRGDWQEE